MVAALLQFLFCAAIVVVAGAALAYFADVIAYRTKLGRLLVGSIGLAFVTSLPELAVDINAIKLGLPDMAVGALTGSSLFNLLILSILDVLVPASRGRMFTRNSHHHSLSALSSVGLTVIVGMGIALPMLGHPMNIGRMSAGSVVVLLGYILMVRWVYQDQRASGYMTNDEEEPKYSMTTAAIGFAVAGVLIFAVSPYLARAAEKIAVISGLGDTFVGMTFVALSTSLPEFVASISAARMGALDLAIGNVFGSNCINMTLLFPLDAMTSDPLLHLVKPVHVFTCMAAILVTTIAVIGKLSHVEKKKTLKLDPTGSLLAALIVGTLYMVYLLR